MKKLIALIVLLILILPINVYAYTVDDLRDLIGADRLDGEYTQSEIDIIIEQYTKIEQANAQVRMFEQFVDEDERKALEEEYNALQSELETAINDLSYAFQDGQPLPDVLSYKSNLENILTKIDKFEGKGFDIQVEYIPNVWEEEYNRVMEMLSKVDSDMYEIGDLGDDLKSPARSGFYITSLFGMRLNPFTKDSIAMHYGLDLHAQENTSILALWNGVVSNIYESESGGLTVEVSHGANLKTVYMHLNKAEVSIGQTVKQYQEIALSGNTGVSTGPHLHLGIYLDGAYINPCLVFGTKALTAVRTYVSNNPSRSDDLRELEKVLKNEPTYDEEDEPEVEEVLEGAYFDGLRREPFSSRKFFENFDGLNTENSENSE